jgi:hypothetical protein
VKNVIIVEIWLKKRDLIVYTYGLFPCSWIYTELKIGLKNDHDFVFALEI